MKKLTLLIAILISNITFSSFENKKITCDIFDHRDYGQVIVHGDSEIHFVMKDGTESSYHHDGYNFEESANELDAIYHDGDDNLFYLDLTTLSNFEDQGLVFVQDEDVADDVYYYPESNYYVVGNCTIEQFMGW